MKCSQPGNQTFPYWEYILSLMTYLEDNIRSRLFCVGFEICTVKIWLFRKKYVSLPYNVSLPMSTRRERAKAQSAQQSKQVVAAVSKQVK